MLFTDLKYGDKCLFCDYGIKISTIDLMSAYLKISCFNCDTIISIFDTYIYEIELFGMKITQLTVEYDNSTINYHDIILRDDQIDSIEKLFDQDYFDLNFYRKIFIKRDLF